MAAKKGREWLSAREVHAAKAGDLSDGKGLLLRVAETGASWVFRYTSPSGRRREMGLGPAHRGSLAQAGEALAAARDAADEARKLLGRGVDPLEARDARRKAEALAAAAKKAEKAREHLTLRRAARAYHERVIEPRMTRKHGCDWLASIENHLSTAILDKPAADVTAPELLRALAGARAHERSRRVEEGARVTETVQRIRQRLDAIYEDLIFHGHATVNPAAAVRRKLREELPAQRAGHHRAMPYRDMPAFMGRLRAAEGTAARCLEFLILTASRTSEALGATWSEVDFGAATWTIAASRMKGGEVHVVHLSVRALEVLKAQVGQHPRLVFPSTMKGHEDKPQSGMAMLVLLGRLGVRDRATVHGMRAAFSSWANEVGAARPDVIEAALAHRESDKVRAAYNRAAFNEERRALLAAWAQYLAGAEVIAFPQRAAG